MYKVSPHGTRSTGLTGKCRSPSLPATQSRAWEASRVARQPGLSLRNVMLSLPGETQEESEAPISQKDKMLPAVNGWYLAFLRASPRSWGDGNGV